MNEAITQLVHNYSLKIKDNRIYFSPDIPKKKLANALNSYATGAQEEDSLVLIDDTLSGDGRNGALLTSSVLYVHNMMEKPEYIDLLNIQSIFFKKGLLESTLHVNSTKFLKTTMPKKDAMQRFTDMLSEIIKQLQVDEDKNSQLHEVHYSEELIINDEMLFQQYSLQLTGKLLEGRSLFDVKKRITAIFKLNLDSTDKLFQNLPVVVKKGLDRNAASKFKNAFEKAGAECRIIPEKSTSTTKPKLHNKKIACRKCGAMILPATSKRTKGLCMPCFKNTQAYRKVTKKQAGKTTKNTVGEYKSSANLYRKCRLDVDQPDILVPPFDAGDLRYISPPSKSLMNSYNIGGGITVAFTKTHFIMDMDKSYCWRVGYDCILSYQYVPRANGGCPRTKREHELDFFIGLEHTYTNTWGQKTSAFGFGISWWNINGMAEKCVPLIQEAVKTVPQSTCPVCGGTDLQIERENIVTGLLSSEDIPTREAVCGDCGIQLKYTTAVGAWMPERDEDMFRPVVSLSKKQEEMTSQVEEVVNRAESMIRVIEKISKQANLEIKQQKGEATLAGTFKVGTMNKRQRDRYYRNQTLKSHIPMLESLEGIRALIFNFANPLGQIKSRLENEVVSKKIQRDGSVESDPRESLLARVCQCYSEINAWATFLN